MPECLQEWNSLQMKKGKYFCFHCILDEFVNLYVLATGIIMDCIN